MNYSAKQILHVYVQVKKEQNEANSKVNTVNIKPAYGNYYIKVDEAFNLLGSDNLKFKNVGYGAVCFLGNLNGKVPTQGLYYKSEEIKNEIETLIKTLSMISDDKSETVKYITDQHGTPKPQHAILWQMA